jgi:Zn-dependent M28 family amino/carboxypeptidase
MRFVLFGGEEEGLLGSFAYVQQHAAELTNCVAMLNTDNGAGHPKGWNAEGRKDVAEALKPLSEALLGGMGGADIHSESDFDTDHGPFLTKGIPALNMWVDGSKYGEVHHTLADTMDKVNQHSLDDGAALIAVTGYALADADQPIAPHLDLNGVRELLKVDGLGEYLKAQGLWDDK